MSSAILAHLVFLDFLKVLGAVNCVTSLESQPCIRSIQSWIGTMMQSYASRVWLQSGGPILLTGIYAMVCYRVATTSDLHGRIRGHPNPTDELWSSVVQNHVAGFRMTPSGTSPWVTNFHKATSNLRASATIIFLRIPTGPPTVRCLNHRANSLSGWNFRNRHANWIRPFRTRMLPARASPFSRRFWPLSSGDPVKPP